MKKAVRNVLIFLGLGGVGLGSYFAIEKYNKKKKDEADPNKTETGLNLVQQPVKQPFNAVGNQEVAALMSNSTPKDTYCVINTQVSPLMLRNSQTTVGTANIIRRMIKGGLVRAKNLNSQWTPVEYKDPENGARYFGYCWGGYLHALPEGNEQETIAKAYYQGTTDESLAKKVGKFFGEVIQLPANVSIQIAQTIFTASQQAGSGFVEALKN